VFSFTPWGKTPGTHWRGGWEGHRTGVVAVEKKKSLATEVLAFLSRKPKVNISVHKSLSLVPVLSDMLYLYIVFCCGLFNDSFHKVIRE
jgi:hypothetical protein